MFLYCKQDAFFKQILLEFNNIGTIFSSNSIKSDQIEENKKEICHFELSESLTNESANEVADEIEQLLNQNDNYLMNKELSQNLIEKSPINEIIEPELN